MKRIKKGFIAIAASVGIILSLPYCTRHDQVLDTTPPVLVTDTLYSVPGTATLQPQGPGHAWDGSIESVWNNAPKLQVKAVVPDVPVEFDGFIGNSSDVTIQSLYDANNIYYLVEFTSPRAYNSSALWYFNSTTKRWAQETGGPALNTDGSYRPPFQQDGFTFAWNIDHSTQKFNTLSCYATCHERTTWGAGTATEGATMHTNGPNERLDCWRCRTLQGGALNQANDVWIDDGAGSYPSASGTLDKNQFHNDWQERNGTASTVPPALRSPGYAADGGFTNRQSLQLTGTTGSTNKVNVPIWLDPNGNYTGSLIMISDTMSKCKKVTAVDTFGVLTLADGSTVDPATGSDYKQIGSGNGAKCIPSTVADIYTGSRADVTMNQYYTGSSWRMLFKRALKTADTQNDVDFSPLEDLPFGIGVMFMGANGQHAIVAGLTQHFRK